ncbi:hypothetical protein C8T65DRAFT_832816 [Cerioporus squamosus]|nr:hypothetical protein C8T65DRAFT_832816 [Cerioporus squamosus]
MDAFFTIASPVPVDEPSVEEILIDAEYRSRSASPHQSIFRTIDMDAFTIAPALPAEVSADDVEIAFVDQESVGTSGSHSGCIIA